MKEKLVRTITYKDKDEIPINHLSLIINVKSINLNFGSVWDFIYKYKLFDGITNGKLLVYQAIRDYDDYYFKNIIRYILQPIGLKYVEDFVITGYILPFGECHSKIKSEMIEAYQGISTNWLINQKVESGCVLKYRKSAVSYPRYSLEELQEKLITYFELTDPRKLEFKPRVIGYENGEIIFGMRKHSGRLILSVENLHRVLFA